MSYQVDDFLTQIANSLSINSMSMDVLQSMDFDSEQENDIQELLQTAAFGQIGKGRPSIGNASSLENKTLMFEKCVKLHQKFIQPENMIICAGGIYNKQEFLHILEEKFSFSSNEEIDLKFEESRYKPSTLIQKRINKTQIVHFDQIDMEAEQIGIAFPIKGMNSEDFHTLYILESILGESSYFSSGGPGKGMHALAVNILRKCQPSTHVLTFKQLYKNHGLFGLIMKGTSGSSEILYSSTKSSLLELKNMIKMEDFVRAKNISISKTLMGLEGQHAKVEEVAKNMYFFDGKIKISSYAEDLQKVKFEDVHRVLDELLGKECCVAAIGNFEWLKGKKTTLEKRKNRFFN